MSAARQYGSLIVACGLVGVGAAILPTGRAVPAVGALGALVELTIGALVAAGVVALVVLLWRSLGMLAALLRQRGSVGGSRRGQPRIGRQSRGRWLRVADWWTSRSWRGPGHRPRPVVDPRTRPRRRDLLDRPGQPTRGYSTATGPRAVVIDSYASVRTELRDPASDSWAALARLYEVARYSRHTVSDAYAEAARRYLTDVDAGR